MRRKRELLFAARAEFRGLKLSVGGPEFRPDPRFTLGYVGQIIWAFGKMMTEMGHTEATLDIEFTLYAA